MKESPHASTQTQDSVIRRLEIIGEATQKYQYLLGEIASRSSLEN